MNEWTTYTDQGAENAESEGGGGRRPATWLGSGGTGRPDLFRRAVDHILRPYARAVAAEGYRLSPRRLAERFGLSDEQRRIVEDALAPKDGTQTQNQLGGDVNGHQRSDNRREDQTSQPEGLPRVPEVYQGQSQNDVREMERGREGEVRRIALADHNYCERAWAKAAYDVITVVVHDEIEKQCGEINEEENFYTITISGNNWY